jgi:hypothetical protein
VCRKSIFVDYKKDMYGRSDADVKEFLKDASSVDDLPKIDRDVLELPEIVVEQYGAPDSYQPALRPAFDALWNTGGYSRSRHFDANGKWKLPR